MYESILLAISNDELSSLLKYLSLILFAGFEKNNLGSQDIRVVSCVMWRWATIRASEILSAIVCGKMSVTLLW